METSAASPKAAQGHQGQHLEVDAEEAEEGQVLQVYSVQEHLSIIELDLQISVIFVLKRVHNTAS